MDEFVELQLSPIWKQAVKEFISANIEPGAVVPIMWFEAALGLDPISPDTTLTAAQFRDRQFRWLRNFDEFRHALLEEHQVCLVAVYGEGYKVVPPAEQTGEATTRFEREVKRAYRKAAVRLKNVRVDQLTDDQRKQNIDAIAKLAMLRGMHRAALLE